MPHPEKQPLDRKAVALGVNGVVLINLAVLLHFATPLGKPVIVVPLVLGAVSALAGLWRFWTAES